MAETETGNVISHEQLTESLRDKREGSVSSSFCTNTLSSMHRSKTILFMYDYNQFWKRRKEMEHMVVEIGNWMAFV